MCESERPEKSSFRAAGESMCSSTHFYLMSFFSSSTDEDDVGRLNRLRDRKEAEKRDVFVWV